MGDVDTGIRTIREFFTDIIRFAELQDRTDASQASGILHYARAGYARAGELKEQLAAERKARPSLGDYTPEG